MFDPVRQLRDLWTPADLTERPSVFSAQVRALMVGARTASPFGILVGGFALWGLWDHLPPVTLAAWFGGLCTVTAGRMWALKSSPQPVAWGFLWSKPKRETS